MDYGLLDAISPLRWYSTMWGLWPFKIIKTGPETRVKLHAWNISFSIPIVSFNTIYLIYYYASQINSEINSLVFQIVGCFVITLVSGAYFGYIFHLKIILREFEKLLRLQKYLKMPPFERKIFGPDYTGLHSLFLLILEAYLNIAINVVSLHFSYLLLLIEKMFAALNEELLGFKENSKRLYLRSLEILPKPSKKTEMHLSHIIIMHDTLCDISGVINQCFGVTNTCISIYVTVQLVASIWTVLLSVERFLLLLLTIYVVVVNWFSLYACECVVAQTKYTSTIVHRLLAHTKDIQFQDQLRCLSMQLIHRKLKFTGLGMFTLNYTSIFSIVGAVTTYLIIILQFQSSGKKDHTNQ